MEYAPLPATLEEALREIKSWRQINRDHIAARAQLEREWVELRALRSAEQPAPVQQETINGRTVAVDWKAQALELREIVRLGGIKIAELEAALAQQQEPVARVIDDGTPEGATEWIPFSSRVEPLKTGEFLYASMQPAQRKPLTPEWIWTWLMDWCKRNGTSPANYDSLFKMVSDARAVEAAHGIKEKNT